MKPAAIIEKWIDRAHANRKAGHSRHLWTARDILEKKLAISEERKTDCIEFLKENVNDSKEKKTVLEALEETK